ncbi:hypothetical protein NW754_005666 [Fusarium falciforme]|uniref:NACHT-NTPase and P-loop NTPases N-terminal domain-containing protein n=1 Tax=Fusarium falciforme TaxID=195108 RepID=A0A9W8R3R0_9HYPO|nr:hypothetical protein NW754_005666 [Fusarium falciforme]KAJ4185173.1 hypothetical protein NW755_008616 [Fusarium falciforme]
MSFGYAIGDVIAVLGLIERVAIELRNYKDAPSHFQQFRVELDLVHSTLQHVLRLEPESDKERQTLDQIRAIPRPFSDHEKPIQYRNKTINILLSVQQLSAHPWTGG